MPDVDHAILTRFSVRAGPYVETFPAEWLHDRLQLLEAYCVPGLVHQTYGDFQWLVFCDESTPRWCLERLSELGEATAAFRIILTSAFRPAIDDVLASFGRLPSVLVTTRLDSDDALSIDYVESVARYVDAFYSSEQPALILNFPYGYKLDVDHGTLYESFQPHSPYMTLFERCDASRSPRTILSGNHGLMHRTYPLHQDVARIAWIQAIHGGNVSNRVVRSERPATQGALEGRFVLRPELAGERAGAPAPQPVREDERARFRAELEESLVAEDY